MTTEKKQSLYGPAFKLLLSILFPSFIIWRTQNLVSKAAWVDHPWFEAQKKKSLKLFFLLLIPSIIAFAGIGISAKNTFSGTFSKLERTREYFKKNQFKKAKDQFSLGVSLEELETFVINSSLFLIPCVFSFSLIHISSSLVRNQRRLIKVLAEHRFWGDQKPRLAVYTPIGILLDVTGHAPKDLVFNKSIWYSLNMVIDEKDFLDQPDQRSIVFFKHAFLLKDVYKYDV